MSLLSWSQQDPCSGYQESADSPHKGPRKFNVITIAYSLANSEVMVADPEGHRFGKDPNGKGVLREIARAFYEDSNTAELDTNMLANERPREIVIDFVRSGAYLLVITAQSKQPQWLRTKTFTCGKRWSKEFTIPASQAGAISRYTLLYDSQGKMEPQLVEGDHTHDPAK
jgi:hypothetical protein